jgi:RimJ/RimL family protein N-acetyltransferase
MTALDLTGKYVRLAVIDVETDTADWARWMEDSEYMRRLDTGPHIPRAQAAIRSWMEKQLGQDYLVFSIRALPEDRLIGFVDLAGFDQTAHSAWVAIGIGEPEYRGRGLGSEAMLLLVRYAFEQLNLHRINLTVFEYNLPAIRSYEKCGFVHEGRQRGFLNRDERRWDLLYMGLLKDDWLAQQRK